MFLFFLEVFPGTMHLHKKVRQEKEEQGTVLNEPLKGTLQALSKPGDVRALKLTSNLRFKPELQSLLSTDVLGSQKVLRWNLGFIY